MLPEALCVRCGQAEAGTAARWLALSHHSGGRKRGRGCFEPKTPGLTHKAYTGGECAFYDIKEGVPINGQARRQQRWRCPAAAAAAAAAACAAAT